MAVHFYPLLLMGMTLLVVTCIQASDSWMNHGAGGALSESQETPQPYEEFEDHNSIVMDNSISATSLREFEDTEYQGLTAIVTTRKTRKMCMKEVVSMGNNYAGATEECKELLKYENLYCHLQARLNGVFPNDWCKYFADVKTCTEQRDCKDSAIEVCCWVPGSKQKQCVSEVPKGPLLYLAVGYSKTEVSTRSKMIEYIRENIAPIPYHNALYVTVLPVGQGDCIAMHCPNGNLVMFDCGSSNRQNGLTAEEVKSVFLREFTRVTIFISHGDEDHYKHLSTVFSDTDRVDQVIIGGSPNEYTSIKSWMDKIASENKLYGINGCKKCIGECNNKLHTIQKSQGCSTDSSHMTDLNSMNICGSPHIHFDIIAANVGSDKNQKSIVLKVKTYSPSVLLAGDMEGSAAKTLVDTVPGKLKSSIFQISHHGAGSKANELDWLHAIRPDMAFVSHTYMGKYGHPRCEAIERLLSIGSITTSKYQTHPFYCAKGAKDGPYFGETCHDIYTTHPTEKDICVIGFRVGGFATITTYQCYQPKSV